MRRALALILGLAALPAVAAPLDPASFEAMAEGHTLHFSRDGEPFGAEQYFPGRRSLWQYPDGTCAEGSWWPEADRVCFSYGAGAERECWSFETGAAGTTARLVEGSDSAQVGELLLDLSGIDQAPLDCPGPDVGT